jgi:hypothetical protein
MLLQCNGIAIAKIIRSINGFLMRLLLLFFALFFVFAFVADESTSIKNHILKIREERNAEMRDTAHSPLKPEEIAKFRELHFFDIDLSYRVIAVFRKAKKQEAIEIPKSELELLLEAALQKGDYREAIRIWFIFLIKELRHKNWITWERKKTNVHYLREMSERRQYDAFSTTVRYFELVWYGKRQLSQEEYRALEPLFSQLLKEVEKA